MIRRATFSAVLGLALAACAPAWAQGPVGGLSSPNLEHVALYPLDGRANGAKKIGRYLYVTTGKTLEILDVSEPDQPVRVGKLDFNPLDVYYPVTGYQEDVDTDGRLLIRSDGGVMQVVDVRDPANPAILSTLDGVDQHTMSCVLSCTWVYGSEGAIVDLRDPLHPKDAGLWTESLQPKSSHDVTEFAPGLVFTATEPMYILDARTDPGHPQVLAEIPAVGFVHGTQWMDDGTDDMALAGGEAIGPSPACQDAPDSTFQTWDTRGWRETRTFKLIDEYRLQAGDEGASASVWCTHWFDAHPAFRSGGLVTIAWYEQGLRLLTVGLDGKITQTGYFLPHGGSIWDVRWITDDILYTFDHHRGIDILRYTGELPPSAPKPASGAPGPAGPSGGTGSPPPPTPKAQARKPVVKLPPARRCVTRRTLSIRARGTAADPLARIFVKVGRKTVRTVQGAALGKPVRLRRVPRRRFTLTVEATARSGLRTVVRRAYRGC